MRTNHILHYALAIVLLLVVALLSSCSDLKTGSDLPVAVSGELQIHDPGWVQKSSSNFHGSVLQKTGYSLSDCAMCHSKQWTGGTSGVTCFTCHQYYPHPAGFKAAGGHPAFLYNQSYPLGQCKSCHGATYNGDGNTALTCMKSGCHVDASNAPKSPESCSACHGTFNATPGTAGAAAPPASVQGQTDASVRGVGAHQKHLVMGTVGKALKCQECHTVPAQLNAAGHLGMLPAEVAFNDTLASLKTAKGSFATIPSYNSSTLKCSNTYCHGSWKIRKATSTTPYVYTDSVMVGANFSPSWTGGASNASCGSCHGLPPTGHVDVALSTCGSCHLGIVGSDGKITDKTKHVNGKINVFGQEYAF